MPTRLHHALHQHLKNHKGQMAVFIALIFQVLFIFFAMVINIGLVVHDKINLQNSVDLGAYYAAQKQAEILNEIAHINYQLHQDYKLLAWRQRVIGNFGYRGHPAAKSAQNQAPSSNTDSDQYDGVGANSESEEPEVCVAWSAWTFGPTNRVANTAQGNCVDNVATPLQNLPAYNQGNSALSAVLNTIFTGGINDALAGSQSTIIQQIQNTCQAAGALNFWATSFFITAYREAITVRKKMILNLASRLSASTGDFKDLQGNSVLAGVKATIKNNLTLANATSLDVNSVKLYNSMANSACAASNQYGSPTWLPEISIEPIILYRDTTYSTSGSGSCNYVKTAYWVPPLYSSQLAILDPTTQLTAIATAREPSINDIQHSTRGYEKNPWCLTYVGVKAQSAPRKPFAPFGDAPTMTAKAFAMPFGGRVGPWYGTKWVRGDPESKDNGGTGAGSGAPTSSASGLVDPLAVPRGTAPQPGAALSHDYYPNYSRYVGDQLGLKSAAAVDFFTPSLRTRFQQQQINPAGFQFNWYQHFLNVTQNGDPLAFVSNPGSGGDNDMRRLEMVAIAPDLFDITYYSVEPDNFGNYFAPQKNSSLFQSGVPPIVPISDLGSHIGVNGFEGNTILAQIGAATNYIQANNSQNIFWMVRDVQHLLTGWVHDLANRYVPPSSLNAGFFATCRAPTTVSGQPGNPGPPQPGACIVGGRVGYSVRLVSLDYLLSGNLQLGGSGGGSGGILNPPPVPF